MYAIILSPPAVLALTVMTAYELCWNPHKKGMLMMRGPCCFEITGEDWSTLLCDTERKNFLDQAGLILVEMVVLEKALFLVVLVAGE